MNRVIADNLAIIDDVLVALISPDARSFTYAELVRDHGYPEDDLFEIDADWV